MSKKRIVVILGILLIIGLGIFLVIKSFIPEKEERISYEREKRLQQVQKQLEGIDLKKVRAKESFIMEKSIQDLQETIQNGNLTYEELTAFYLDRIQRFDLQKNGINALVEVNPHAIEQARAYDKTTEKGSGMTGIPVLIKDNVNTKDMPTSGGTYALKDFKPNENARLVNELIKSKAIILGKSNLSELANFMDLKMPSGYSSKTGQTHNPFHPLKISPSGSSSGSGAAVAANFCAVAIGTETTGSIIAPAAIHSIVGFKPQKDVISTEGVIPLSSTLDAVGTMAKTVKDAVALYNASITDKSRTIKLQSHEQFIKGKRIGLVGDDLETIEKYLRESGAVAVPIKLSEKGIDNGYIIDQDFKGDLNRYLKTYSAPVKSLSALIAFNQEDKLKRAKYGQRFIQKANKVTEFDRQKVKKMVKEAQDRLIDQFSKNHLDAIVFLDNSGVLLPAVAGYPEMTVPIGESPEGEPTGATFVTLKNQDEILANISYSFEQKTKARLIPKKYITQ